MKASGVHVQLTAAFGGVAGIITGKSWANSLRAYRLITTAMFQDFFQRGAKTYQELSEYSEAAREHPVGRLWVDCLIKPSRLPFQVGTACTERRRLPTPAGQPRGDDALHICGGVHELLPLHDLVSEERCEPDNGGQ